MTDIIKKTRLYGTHNIYTNIQGDESIFNKLNLENAYNYVLQTLSDH